MNPKKKYIRYMKRNLAPHLFPMLAAVFLLLVACAHRPDPQATTVLSQAEAIMYAAPDSALQLLENLQPPKGKEQRATWALLLAQARFKNDIEQTDSLVNTAYSYFEKTDDAERKALALYLKGSLEDEAKHIDEAQTFYLKAKENADRTENYRLRFLIDSHLCNLYAYQNLKEYALASIEEAEQSARQLGDTTYLLSSYLFKARVHSMSPYDEKKVIHYYTEGIELAKACHNLNRLEDMTWELAGFYSTIKQHEKALEITRQGLKLYTGNNRPYPARSLGIIGRIYSNMNIVDSATYYLQKTIDAAENPNLKGSSYDDLQRMYGRAGKYKEAWQASKQALHLYDSIRWANQSSELIEMQAKYDQQEIIIQRNQLQIEKDRIAHNALLALICAILFIAILVGWYQRILIKKERTLKKQEELVRQNAQQMTENDMQILRNKQRMAELIQQIEIDKNLREQVEEQTYSLEKIRKQNEQLITENEQLQQDINRQVLSIELQSKELNELKKMAAQNKYLHERESLLVNLLIKNNAFLSKIKNQHAYIKDDQWETLKEELNAIFDSYVQRLQKQIPSISEGELRLACLIKLKMSNGEMAESLGISPSSVSKSKLRLKDRISHVIPSFDKNILLDVWLWDF